MLVPKTPLAPPQILFFLLTGPGKETELQLPPFPTELLPDTVLSGVLQGLYLPWGCPAAPRAPGPP